MSEDFNILYNRIRDKIFRFALRMLNNNYEEACDAVQDVFEKLWKMRKDLAQYENPEALSIKMTKNLCLDRLKHEKIKAQKMKGRMNSSETISTNTYEEKNTSEIIQGLIHQLPEKQKMIIHLRDIEGFELDEIANIMEINITAVRMNLSRGRSTLREKLIKMMNYGIQGDKAFTGSVF